MDTRTIQCPYCGQHIEISIDRTVRLQEYIEDCQVCCRPIVLTVTLSEGRDPDVHIVARSEDG